MEKEDALTLAKTVEDIFKNREEIEDIKKGGPIAMADFTIINESSLEDLGQQTKGIISRLR